MNKDEVNEVIKKYKLRSNSDGKEEKRVNLNGEDLKGIDLSFTDLRYADLTNANLQGADLFSANLGNADLTNANLQGADLRNTDLTNANLTGANLKDACLNWASTQDIRGCTVIGVQTNTTRENNLISYWKELGIVTSGCFQGTLEELEKQVNITHASNPPLKNKYIETIKFIKILLNQDEEQE